jgi:phospholipid/cholesterol/gamma-HCH transport system substrate-binding protein
MQKNQQVKEAWYGFAVLLLITMIMVLSNLKLSHKKSDSYNLTARFSKAEGIGIGSDVRLAGMKVGKVVTQSLDSHYRAVLKLQIDNKIHIPKDSAALIQTEGVLGGKFIALQPGGDEDSLLPDTEILFTQDSVNVTDLLLQVIAQAEANRSKRLTQDSGSVVINH